MFRQQTTQLLSAFAVLEKRGSASVPGTVVALRSLTTMM